jgi:glutamate racemase
VKIAPAPEPVKIALIDSGIGLLAAAAALRRLRPDADLVLAGDPDGMPWGPRTPADVTERALACAEAAAAHRPDALVVACNTASVHALDALRARLEPGIPVVGTVPAIKPAAALGGPVAIWATPATTGSPYQRRLIADFADGVPVTEVPCPGLADALEHADDEAVAAAVAAAAARTPAEATAVVLGCTHYELAAERIRAALRPHPCESAPPIDGTPPGPGAPLRGAVPRGAAAPPDALVPLTLHGSAHAVAAQVLRRIGAPPAPDAPAVGGLTVLLSGRPADLPHAALAYPQGRGLLAVRPSATAPGAGSGTVAAAESVPAARS